MENKAGFLRGRIDAILYVTRIPMAFVQTLFIALGFLSAGGTDFLRLGWAVLTLGPTMIYGGIYVLNDILDREEDKNHPKKSMRPLVSQKYLTVGSAKMLSLSLLAVGLVSAYFIGPLFFLISLLILANNLTYSLKPRLKNHFYTGLMSCSLNYPLRFLAGASLAGLNLKMILFSALCFAAALDGFAAYRIYDIQNATKKVKDSVKINRTLTLISRLASVAAFFTIIIASGLSHKPYLGLAFGTYLLVFSETNLSLAQKGVDFFKLLRIHKTVKIWPQYIHHPLMTYALALLSIYFILNV